ncbi:apoptotic chromatin condensation inducer in the nucleus [Drosophila elegans]|uniref:apoptotic chromatin condensation inducer in the nucleus n=1 Tax=Drosophila elegans TaxID=30023 RepID=UPI0007E5EA07|nr:apoptotic chromatin condensation inducer in the nucleus [Drosophila elegans]
MTKFVVVGLCLCLLVAFSQLAAAVTEAPEVEQSTESPIADMALIEETPMAPKMPTEKPPVVAVQEAPSMVSPVEIQEKAAPQPHTVADFIIHPLIAFKPRQASLEEIQGKQASAAPGSSAPASPGTWLFGMNPAQQLGSSFSTLAGSVSGWFNDRLQAAGQQLPGLVETPVRGESTTSTSSTTSTTTQRPDIVVRVQQRPQRNGNRNGNLNNNNNLNNMNNRRRQQRPNRFNNRLDSFEDDYYEDDYLQGNRFDEEFDDDEDEQSLEQFEDDDSLELRPQQKPKKQRKQTQVQAQNQRRKFQQEEQVVVSQKRRQPVNQNSNKKVKAQKKPVIEEAQDDEEEEDEGANNDDDDDEEEEEQVQEDDSQEQDFHQEPLYASTSTRRSQNQPNFIQRGQQSIISQIRQFTRGQTPAELGNTLRRTSSSSSASSAAGANASKTRRPQATTFLVNRNGQTVYLAPELLNLNSSPYPYAYVQGQGKRQRVPVAGNFPQPPLTVPVRRQGRPTQYITIPWSQLGLSPPDQQSVVSLAEGIQAQPLILNIPQSAISPVRGTSGSKKQRPQLTASAVPLLADASLMDIFQPPQIPPSRNGSPSSASSSGSGSGAGSGSIKPISAQPVLIAAKPVKAGGLLPSRIRPGTIVEKAPAMDAAMEKPAMEATEMKQEQEMMAGGETAAAAPQMASEGGQEFILVGDDDEPGLSRHVQPAFGDARYVSYGDFHPYFDLLTQNRRFALRKTGRSLESAGPEEQVAPRALTTFGKVPQMEEEQKEEVQKMAVQKEEVQEMEVQMEEVKKEEMPKEEIQMEEAQKMEVQKEEVQEKEVPKEEIQKDEIKKEEPQQEQPKMEEQAKLAA